MEMFSSIDIDSSVAVYVQLENLVRFQIAAGRLQPGDKLPSVRELSEAVDVNPNTVAKAYRDLEVMGIVNSRRGMGVYIAKSSSRTVSDQTRRQILSRLYEVCGEARAAGLKDAEIVKAAKQCLSGDCRPYSEVPSDVLSLAKSS